MTKSYHYLFGIWAIIVFILLFSFVPRSCSSEDIDELVPEVSEDSSSGTTDEVTISDFSLDKVFVYLTEGEGEQLTVTVIMSDGSEYTGSYTWVSSNEDVAIVVDGYIYAVGEGDCYINVYLDNGEHATCIVVVSEYVDPDKGDDDNPSTPDPSEEVHDVFEPTFEYTDKFFYRVGNENEVELGYIFSVIVGYEDLVDDVEITYEAVEEGTNVSVTYTKSTDGVWSHGILQFEGSGLIKLTISVYAEEDELENYNIKPYSEDLTDGGVPEGDILINSFELYLEVEDGGNVTNITQLNGKGEDCDVLLCDVETDSYDRITYEGESRLFGNGFSLTINATSQYSGGAIELKDSARMDHLVVTVADHYDVFNQSDYILFNDAVECSGDNIIIANCYIQGGRAAVRNRASNLIIRDTVINGGAYANLLISSPCDVTLENVTTNQYVTDGQYEGQTGVMGFGVLVEEQGKGSNITVIGDLKQYNWIREEDTKYFDYSFEHDSYTSLSEGLASVFETYKNYEYEDEDHEMELNTGILGLDADFTVDFTQITEGIVYHEITIISELWASLKGYTVDASATSEDYIFTDFEFNPSNILDYGVVEPYFHWNLESDEEESGTTFVYNADTKLVTITIAVGDSDGYTWTPAITITKYGIPLDYTLIMDKTKDVKDGYTFTSEDEGDHYIVAEYEDEYNYKRNGEDEADVESYTLSYSQTLHISVIVEVETTKHAEFKFTSNDGSTTYDTKVIDIGFDHYVTIDNYDGKYNDYEVVEYNPTDDNGNPLTDEKGEVVTLYAPKEYSAKSGFVYQILGDLYWYYPVLTTITVYDWTDGIQESDEEADIVYDRSNKTTSGLFSFGDETPFDVLTPSSNYWSGPYDVATNCSFTTNNKVLCIQSYVRNYNNSYSAQEFIGEFTYTDEAGQIFHYGIDYYRAAHTP